MSASESDRDFVQLLRDEADEWGDGSETGALLREAARRLSDALDYNDNLERGLSFARAENDTLRKTAHLPRVPVGQWEQ